MIKCLPGRAAVGSWLYRVSTRRSRRHVGERFALSTLYRVLARRGWRKRAPDTAHPQGDASRRETFKKTPRCGGGSPEFVPTHLRSWRLGSSGSAYGKLPLTVPLLPAPHFPLCHNVGTQCFFGTIGGSGQISTLNWNLLPGGHTISAWKQRAQR